MFEKILKGNKVKQRGETRAMVQKLKTSGASCSEIARTLEISKQAVSRHLMSSNAPSQPRLAGTTKEETNG